MSLLICRIYKTKQRMKTTSKIQRIDQWLTECFVYLERHGGEGARVYADYLKEHSASTMTCLLTKCTCTFRKAIKGT